jgi:hypothetical protein
VSRVDRVLAAAQHVSADRRVQAGFVAVTVVAAALAVVLDYEEFVAAARQLGLGSIALAFGLTLVNVLAAAAAWRSVLADLGSRLPVAGAFRVFLVGALGKYLPGSVWFLIAQTQMAARQHVPRQRAASASIVTVVLTVATAALASLLAVPFAGDLPGWFRWTPLLLPVILAALWPPLLNRVMTRVFELIRRPPLEHELSPLGIVRAVSWSLLSWLAVGGQVAVLAVTVGAPLEWRTVVLCLGGYALAWALGFAAVVAPAGAGAREATLALALSPVLSPGPALVVVLVSRVLLTVADLSLAGLFGSGLGRLGEGAGEPEPSR